jgi:hypothetical protein
MKKICTAMFCFGFVAVQLLLGQAKKETIGKWVNERGVMVAEITTENLYVAENILRWGKLSKSGHRIFPENGYYKLDIHEDGAGASAFASGNRWGGSNIGASFSLNEDGSLTLTIENKAYDNFEQLGEYENKQTFLLHRKR